MDNGVRDSTGFPTSGSTSNTMGDFECNICFELAEDPIVTLCGHLYCWPCLYRWLHGHSHSQECPVCKALVEEEKLVPIYGRGKSGLDPRRRSISDIQIPNRPSGQRPETAPPPDPNPNPNPNHFRQEFTQNRRAGDMSFSAGFGGLMPFFNFQAHGFNYANAYGANMGFPYWFPGSFHGVMLMGFIIITTI
ncbi:Ubiquitin--protein ligase [Bertholletia excelsa]